MAKKPPSGDGRRIGAERGRIQVLNPRTGQWVKRDNTTVRFMGVKQDSKPFKGVTKK